MVRFASSFALLSFCVLFSFSADAVEALIRTLPDWVQQSSQANNRLIKAGYLPVDLYDGYKPDGGNQTYPLRGDGVTDCTVALQKAIEDARDHNLVLFFPPGTYLVSDTLKAVMLVTARNQKWNNAWRKSNMWVGDPRGARPVIKLSANAAGFNDPNNPKPIVAMWSQCTGNERGCSGPPDMIVDHEQENVAFNQLFRGINIDCGRGQSGCVGLRDAAAQGSSVENVKVRVGDGYAGFWNLPSRAWGAINLEVVGGKYGLWLPKNTVTVIAGLRLSDQRDAAIFSPSIAPVVIVGFDIQKKESPVITAGAPSWSSSGSFVFIDGKMEVTQGSAPMIDNSAGRTLYLREVFMKGATKRIQSGVESAVTGSGWSRVLDYAYADKKTYMSRNETRTTSNWIEGTQSSAEIKSVMPADLPPSTLLSRHLPPKLPFPLDEGVIWATEVGAKGDGIANDSAALQAALDTHDTLFLPKGEYLLGETLRLGSKSRVFGVARNLASLSPHSSWCPTSESAIVATPNDREATTMLAELWISPRVKPSRCDFFQALHWQAGRRSVLRGMVFRHANAWPVPEETNKRRSILVDGMGGGRFYFIDQGNTANVKHPDYRILKVDSTSEPLRIYGLDPEHAQASPFVEFLNAKNVQIYGVKAELTHGTTQVIPDFDLVNISGGSNFFIAGHGMFGGARPNYAMWRLSEVNNIELAAIDLTTGKDISNTLIENFSGATTQIHGATRIALFRRGKATRKYMEASPDLLHFSLRAGESSQIRVVKVQNAGEASFQWRVDCPSPMVKCTAVNAGLPGEIEVLVHANQQLGRHESELLITALETINGQIAIPIVVEITAASGESDMGRAGDTSQDPSSKGDTKDLESGVDLPSLVTRDIVEMDDPEPVNVSLVQGGCCATAGTQSGEGQGFLVFLLALFWGVRRKRSR